eukprot:13665893-Ditylum_brightwellii.AAC.1
MEDWAMQLLERSSMGDFRTEKFCIWGHLKDLNGSIPRMYFCSCNRQYMALIRLQCSSGENSNELLSI